MGIKIIDRNLEKLRQNVQTKTAYQQNLSQPVQTQTEKPWSTSRVMGNIAKIGAYDQAKAQKMFDDLMYLRSDPSSKYYNAYATYTNKAIDTLASYGIDTSRIDDDFYKKNDYLLGDLVYNGQTNTPTDVSKSKKATPQQKIAYAYYQIKLANEDTGKAKTQYNALRDEVSYWATRADRNYSDEQIMDMIDWKKYGMLDSMKEKAALGKPTELNEGFDISDDAIHAMIWAARNGSSGSLYGDMARAYNGEGKVWQNNQDTADKLNPLSDKFKPYAVGSTGKEIDAAAAYFNVPYFERDWCNQHNGMQWSNDKTEKEMWQYVYNGEQNCRSAEDALSALNQWIDEKSPRWKSREQAEKAFNDAYDKGYVTVNVNGKRQKVDISMLKKMDDSMGRPDLNEVGNGTILNMTRPVDYKYGDYLQKISDIGYENSKVPMDVAYVDDLDAMTGVDPIKHTDVDAAIFQEQNKTLGEAAELFDGAGTESEQSMGKNLWSSAFGLVKEGAAQVKNSIPGKFTELTQNTIKSSVGNLSSAMLTDADVVQNYNIATESIPELQKKKAELEEQMGGGAGYIDAGKFDDSLVDKYGNVSLEEQPGWDLLTDQEKIALSNILNTADNQSVAVDMVKSLYNKYMSDHTSESVNDDIANEYRDVTNQLAEAENYVAANQGTYDNAVANAQSAQQQYDALINMFESAGLDSTELKEAKTVSNFLLGFTKYNPTKWESENVYAEYSHMAMANDGSFDKMYQVAEQTDQEILKNIEVAEWVLDYSERNGVQMPDSVKNNVQRWLNAMQRQHEDFENLSVLKNEDRDEMVAKGHEMANNPSEFDWNAYDGTLESQPAWNLLSEQQKETLLSMTENYDINDIANQMNGYLEGMDVENRLFGTYRMSDLLADYEKETFYYLLGKEGLEGANAYIDHLSDASYGVLNTRAAEKTRESADALAGSGFWGRRAADALSMLMSPVAAIGSAYYMAEVGLAKARGEMVEVNPDNVNLSANIYKKEARAKIQEEIARVYGKDTALGKFMSGLQEIISNRGDSMVNALTFGPLFKGVSPEMLNEFLSATPMAFAAATDAVADAKEKGASDTQLLGIFAATFLAEAGTEAVSIDNMRDAFGMGGGGFNGKTVREFLHNWLTKAGISEMFGESLNDFIENTADELIMGDQSEFQQNVQKHMTEEHMSREDAELAARRDQMMGILHTALISYLSPGMDIGSFAAGSLNYYKGEAKALQQQGYDVSIFDIMKANKERRLAPAETKQTEVQNEQAETTEQAPAEETQEQTEVSSAEEAGAAVPVYEADTAVEIDPEQQKAEQIAADYQILDNAGKADATSQTATIASVLQVDESDVSSDAAKAAAAKINEMVSSLPGKHLSAVEWLKNLWLGASETKVSLETVKQAVTSAVLGGEQSAAYQQFRKGKFRKADFDAQVLRLAKAVESDNANQTVQEQIAKSIHEARIVEAEGQIIANGQQLGGNKINLAMKAQQTADKAAKALMKARENLETRQNELTAATDALNQANEDLRNNPTDEMRKRVVGAISKFNSLAAVVQEYQQSLVKAEQDNTVAQENAEKARDEALTEVRQQAEQMVAEEDQRRVGIAIEQEQIAQQEAEQAAAVEAVTNEVNNIARNDADAFIEQTNPNATEEEKQKIRDMFARIQAEAPVNPIARDENGQMTPEAVQRRDKFVQQASKKFGVNINILDTTHGGTVERQNGYYDRRNNRIVLDQNSTIDDAMFFVLGHELTHVAESSQTYNALANSLLRIRYGVDQNKMNADIMAKKSLYDQRLAQMHEQDNTIDATPLTEAEARQELVADIMGDLLHGDQDLVNRLVAEEPSTARKILNSIKSFLKKAIGLKGAWVSDAQRTVDMLETALKESKAKRQQGRVQYSLTEGENINEIDVNARPLVKDDEGNELATELPGGTVAADKDRSYILSSWTEKEVSKVRSSLLKNGFTEEQADKWINDVNSIAAIIAQDKDRLDFTPDRNQKFKKPNGDVYKWTLDASTLCAKRLLYQGTFNEIQKLMPNTPLYAGDLIELSNMMREMGYQTPCGICYVESQRRDSGKFTEEFIQKYAKEHEGEFIPTFADLTTSDGLYRLRDEHKEVYDAYIKANNARGSGSTKPVQLRTDYRGDVRNLTSDSIEYLKEIGGLRINSFSDFETPHLMDMMQAVLDMAAVKLTSQAYTKVPNFAAVFGDTGIKINLSLMGDGNGLDENGNLIFSNTEGMDFDEAMKLRDRYSKNVGTILVGMNDAQIKAAMADPRIDFIIPFHRSGWSEENRQKMTSLANYKDYQDYQNERDIKTGKKAASNIEPGYVVNEDGTTDGYWDYNKSGKENAETYLKLCKEKGLIPKFEQFLVNNGDGSYSLQPDGSTDGYWKTLIDFKMYENDGDGSNGEVKGSPQTVVTPNINMEEAYRVLNEFDGTGVNSLPVAQPVVDRYVEEYKANHPLDENRTKYSLPSDNLLEQQIRQYLQRGGSLAPNNPAAGIRQWGNKGAQQSDVLSKQAKDYVLNSPYMKDTNAKELARAIDWIGKNSSKADPDGYYESLRKVTAPGFNFRTKDGQARMIAMMGMAVAHDNDVNAQIALADAYNRQGTAIGQALQARKLFRLMTPEGRIAVMRKMLNDTQDEINRKGSNVELAFSDWVYKAAANATDENDFAAVQQAAAKELAEQIPSNWKDKLRGIRMLSMLGNPRTHIRNIIGNALFVPAVGLKNKLGAVAEIVSGQENRTKTLSLFLNKESRQFAKEDVLKMKDTLTGEAKYNEGNLVKREQKPFKGLLQAVIDFNGNMLEKEDWTFLRGHYIRALGGWMQANGYTAEQLNNNSDLLDQGRAYAIQEAQKATYRDFNKMAQTLNNVSRNGGVAGFIVDATLPFKKTPANILKRGLEYSPAGIMKSLTSDIYHLKQWMDFENGKLNALPEKAISPTEFIDHLCSGLAGSAIMAMGFLLANSGIVTCGLDDDDDELEKAKGNQKYAFKASILGKDITFTMDWAAPMSMPFFVGAAIQNQLSKGGDIDINEVINAFGNITEPVFNLSMLDGVNTLFKTSQYDDTNTLTQIGANVVSNYVTSYVPSMIGAIARTIDDKQRKNFVESGKGTGVMGTFRYALEQAENKIPVLNKQNIPVRDVWGNEQTSSLAERILENFILPGYVSEYKDDPILNEIGRVYDATQDLSLMPSDPPKSFSYKNDKIVLTDKQWDAYKEQRGQTAFNMLTELMQNPDYLNASAATQADMIKDVWSYADKMGRKTVIPDFDMVTSNVGAIAEEGKIDGYKNEMVKALQLGDIDAYETMVEALLEEEVSESEIRKKIQDTYINKYKDAYRRSDYEEMADIQEILDDSGFDFDTDAWEEAVDKKYGI